MVLPWILLAAGGAAAIWAWRDQRAALHECDEVIRIGFAGRLATAHDALGTGQSGLGTIGGATVRLRNVGRDALAPGTECRVHDVSNLTLLVRASVDN